MKRVRGLAWMLIGAGLAWPGCQRPSEKARPGPPPRRPVPAAKAPSKAPTLPTLGKMPPPPGQPFPYPFKAPQAAPPQAEAFPFAKMPPGMVIPAPKAPRPRGPYPGKGPLTTGAVPPGPPAPKPPSAPAIALVGIISDGSPGVAVIKKDSATYFLKPGEKVDGYTLVKIARDQVILEGKAGRLTLRLR